MSKHTHDDGHIEETLSTEEGINVAPPNLRIELPQKSPFGQENQGSDYSNHKNNTLTDCENQITPPPPTEKEFIESSLAQKRAMRRRSVRLSAFPSSPSLTLANEEIKDSFSQVNSFIRSPHHWWKYNENSLFSLLFQAPTCFLYTSSQQLIHHSIIASVCLYILFTLYDSFVSNDLLVPSRSYLYLVMILFFSGLLLTEKFYALDNSKKCTTASEIAPTDSKKEEKKNSCENEVQQEKHNGAIVWSVNLLMTFAYITPYIILAYGGVETIETRSVLHLIKWILVPLVFTGILITRLIAIILIYSIHIIFILLLPVLFPSFVRMDHVHIILSCVVPMKMCILFIYFFMVKQQRRLQTQMKHCFDMMMVTSEAIVIHKDGTIIDVNPAFKNLFGYSTVECKHIQLKQLFVEAPFDCLVGHQDIAKLTSSHNFKNANTTMRNTTPTSENSTSILKMPRKVIFECIGKTKSGKSLALEVISKIQSYLGEDVYVLSIRSIESRQEKEIVLDDMDDMKAKSRFLSIVSHELKTPINAIQLLGEMIQEECSDLEDVRENAKIIQKSSEHLLMVIKDILDYSKLDIGTLPLNSDTFDLPQCIEDVIDVVAPKAYDKGLEIAVFASKTLPRKLVGDSNRIQQLLSNLVSNAIKFTDQGQVVITVELVSESETEVEIFISVKDSGIGISRINQKKLFRMFSQVDNSAKRKYDGTGLGLAICKQLVSLMGGSIGVKSKVDEGSEFYFGVCLKKPSIDITSVDHQAEQERVPIDHSIYGPSDANYAPYDSTDPHSRSNPFSFGNFGHSITDDTHSVAIVERRRSRGAVFVDVNGDDQKNMVILNDAEAKQVFAVDVNSDTMPSSGCTPFTTQLTDNIFDESESELGRSRGQILLIFDNTEIASVLCKYMHSFDAKCLLASSVPMVLHDQLKYITEPIEAVIIDEACLQSDDEEDILDLLKQLRKAITASNNQLSFEPATPLMVLALFSKASIFEDLLLQFKLCIRKPIYLSLIEKLFYNDLVVHRRYPIYESEFDDSDSDAKSLSEHSSHIATPDQENAHGRSSLPHTLSYPKQRIYVSFEVRPVRRFSSFTRRLSCPLVKPATKEVVHKNSTPNVLKSSGINRFQSPRNKRLSLFTKFMLQEKLSSPVRYIHNIIDKVQRLHSVPRLLMVEDQPINQKITKRVIESLGVQVEIAEHGLEALNKLNIPVDEGEEDLSVQDSQLFEYDIILMDGNMPKLDGMETSKRIRAFESKMFGKITNTQPYRIPIIGLTASSEEKFQKKCLESGMDEVLSKPVKRQALEKMLLKYLQENEEWKKFRESQSASENSSIATGSNSSFGGGVSLEIQEHAYKQIASYRMTPK